MLEVRVSDFVAEKIAANFDFERSSTGQPSELDFWSGPLAAAIVRFQAFEDLPFDTNAEIRRLHTFHPFFGPVVFIGVLLEPGIVEIADFAIDLDYPEMIMDGPTD